MQKPELLLPVGNPEAFYASLKAGADAIYLGLKQFNARGRAKNFTNGQLFTILKEAKEKNVQIYITLNTVIKNHELPELLDYLHFLEQAKVDGIIIQDWGVFYIAKKFFPKLILHASTQIGIHNSLGANNAGKQGFERVVLARELTFNELKEICSKTTVETEVFIHGALCYSMSGMCLYSSYAGGRGANRGLCTQPCRRIYYSDHDQQYLFNLKDNQLIDFMEKFKELGITSLKVEGRMKSGEYAYRVAKSYRMAIDDKENLPDAKELISLDFGREKTAYFMGKDVNQAVSDKTVAGIYLGKVKQIQGQYLWLSSKMEIEPGFRLRFHVPDSEKQESIKVREVEKDNDLYKINLAGKQIRKNSQVYLSGISDIKFPSKLEESNKQVFPLAFKQKQRILSSLKVKTTAQKDEFYFRINSLEWLKKMNLNEMNGLFLAFPKNIWEDFNPQVPFIQKFRDKIYVEFPKFIQESALPFYRQLAEKMVKNGIKNFVVSHISQEDLLPKGCKIITNENVYAFNDAAIKFYKTKGVSTFCYPQEIDFETLFSLSNKDGIVPTYFYPELFHSRMPVNLHDTDNKFTDDMDIKLQRFRKNGITSVVPAIPVSLSQSKNKLKQKGFSKFLIDLSYETVSKNRAKTIKSRILRSEQIQPSNTFNFNKGLK
jgi:putative protease